MKRWSAVFGAALLMACSSPTPQSNFSSPAPPAPGDPYAALERLADQIRASARVARENPASELPFGQGEGALHVLRLLRRAIDEELAWADTDHPFFQAQDERYAKLALGNPDNLYLVTRVEDDAVYRIRGRRGTTADFTIQVYQGYPGVHRPMRAEGALGLDALVTDEDGNFEVVVGGPPRDANWIELLPDSRRILVRFTYGDWSREEAGDLRIERVGKRGERRVPVDDAEIAGRIGKTADYLGDALTGYLKIVDQVYDGLPVNTLRPLRQMSGAAGGLLNQYSATGRYKLRDDQALVVTTRPSDADYQGFQIGTEWFEALDFVNQTTSLNTMQAKLSSDGVYRFVISTRDPGVANWLDASGAPQGQMLLRWQRVGELDASHAPTIILIDFASIRAQFPRDEDVFNAADRRAQIAERQDAIERRYGLHRR